MVNTRSRTAKNTQSDMDGTDRYSNAESEISIPEVLTREQMNEFDSGNLLDYRNESERHTVNQRFNEMNKQISELTNLVFALTEKISSNDEISSSNREGNDLNTVSIVPTRPVPTMPVPTRPVPTTPECYWSALFVENADYCSDFSF